MVDLVNVLFVSDHGMTQLPGKSFVNLSDFLDMEDIEHTAQGDSVFSIWPKADKVDKVSDIGYVVYLYPG